ncbi:Nuclear pore complex protein [Schizosaccharomyces pombe]
MHQNALNNATLNVLGHKKNGSSSIQELIEMDEEEAEMNQNVVCIGPNETAVSVELGDEYEKFNIITSLKKDNLFSKDGLLYAYYELCQEKFEKCLKEDDEEWMGLWDLESRTWDLIQRLYSFRLSEQQEHIQSHAFSSRAVLEEEYYSQNPEAFENNIVFNWARDNSSDPPSIEIRGNRWFYTREDIKMKNRGGSRFSSNISGTIVSNLDPDADIRDDKRLDERDDNFERQFFHTAFCLFRSGSFEELLELCRRTGNHWRSASLQGILEYRDNLIDDVLQSETSGNKRKELLRRSCLALTKNKRIDSYERALYGALCGDLNSVLDVCTTWEDAMWAYYNSMTQYNLDVYLSSKAPQTETQLPPVDSGLGLTPELIFNSLSNSSIASIQEEASHPLIKLQTHIICNKISEILSSAHIQLEAIRTGNAPESGDLVTPPLLRILTHIILFLKISGLAVDEYTSDSIIQAYIELLASAKKVNLVPLYIQYLSNQVQYEAYSRFLILVDEESARSEQLQLAKKYSLDINHAALLAVEYVYDEVVSVSPEEVHTVYLKSIEEPVEPSYKKLICTLEWLLITSQTDELLRFANLVYRFFLSIGELNSAYDLYTHIPSDALNTLSSSDGEPENDSKFRDAYELMNYRALCRALKFYQEWEELSKQEVFEDSAVTKASTSYKDWKKKLNFASRKCVKSFTDLLQANWLHPSTLELKPDDDPLLYKTLMTIRNLYVPELILGLHNVYFSLEDYDSCFALANEVASEDLKLYHCLIESGRLVEYVSNLGKAGECSLSTPNGLFSL